MSALILNKALLEACRTGDFPGAKLLLESGADVNGRFLCIGQLSPLMMSCLRGHVEISRLLLESGANAKEKNGGFESALNYALRAYTPPTLGNLFFYWLNMESTFIIAKAFVARAILLFLVP